MASKPDELLPSASDYMKKLALTEAEEASKHARELAEGDAEKHALIDRLRSRRAFPTRRPFIAPSRSSNAQ